VITRCEFELGRSTRAAVNPTATGLVLASAVDRCVPTGAVHPEVTKGPGVLLERPSRSRVPALLPGRSEPLWQGLGDCL
jgi:hypothetical protein